MDETVITVRGEHSARYPAERAVVQVSVRFDGPKREPVFDSTTASAEAVRQAITALHNEKTGPVTSWSSDRVSVWSERPWNQDGKQLPAVFHAAIDFSATFTDFDALALWVERVASVAGVAIHQTSWDLTEEHRKAVTAEVRSLAVKDAVAKASALAGSIGLKQVRAVALADSGMLSDPSGGATGAFGFMQADRQAAGPAVSLKPEDIEVSATVDARFLAS